ncbi:unnamed protein product [Rotaria socialis]|uniref:Uncharacterized protein n=1 Tax=Rotaria socialis TaxID=392032 RepID=A0A818H351_9BILA|nr:unnamed protein product [Rotaria socialis]CAF4904830.1 unnamed protein product [Rotaria socialis]
MVEEIFPLPIDKTKENKNVVQNFSEIKVPIKTDTITEKVKTIPINLNSDTDDTKGFPIWKDSILCDHMTTNLSVTKIFFTEFRSNPYCCLWDTGSSINLISDSMAEQLMSEKIATASGSEEVNIAGSGGKNLKMTMRYVTLSIWLERFRHYEDLVFGMMPDDRMPACIILSFNMMSRYALILNYSDMRLQDNSSDLQNLGKIALHPDKPSDNLDLNDPLQYLTEGLNLHSLPRGKRITVRQGFQEDYLTSRKLEIDAAILKNHPPSLNSYRDNTKHWQEYLGMSKCFEMDNGDPDNVVAKVNKKPIEVDELGNLISFHELNKKHEPNNKFLKSVLNNLIDKDEESIVEQIDPPTDSKSSLDILMNSIKRANGIPVDGDNWLNLPKSDPIINETEKKTHC